MKKTEDIILLIEQIKELAENNQELIKAGSIEICINDCDVQFVKSFKDKCESFIEPSTFYSKYLSCIKIGGVDVKLRSVDVKFDVIIYE